MRFHGDVGGFHRWDVVAALVRARGARRVAEIGVWTALTAEFVPARRSDAWSRRVFFVGPLHDDGGGVFIARLTCCSFELNASPVKQNSGGVFTSCISVALATGTWDTLR